MVWVISGTRGIGLHAPVLPTPAVVPGDSNQLAVEAQLGSTGPRSVKACQGLGAAFLPAVFARELVAWLLLRQKAAAVTMPHRLLREEGLWPGISGSANLAAALRVARRGKIIVTVLSDSGERSL